MGWVHNLGYYIISWNQSLMLQVLILVLSLISTRMYLQNYSFNLYTTGNAWVHTQHCNYWCPGAKAPGHQYPQCWLTIDYIGTVSHWKGIILENKITFKKIIFSHLRVNPHNQMDHTMLLSHVILLPTSYKHCLLSVASSGPYYLQIATINSLI